MVIHNSYPEKFAPILVQTNYISGSIAFFIARHQEDIDGYSHIVAIFKCKPKCKPKLKP
jgi:hypothetical protein